MESVTKESAISTNAGVSSPSSSSSGYKPVSHNSTISSDSKVKQDTKRSHKKNGTETSLVLASPTDIIADKELDKSARAATVAVIVALTLSMFMLILHFGQKYTEPATTEPPFVNYSIIVPEAEERAPITWPTLKPLPVKPPATEMETSTVEEPPVSQTVDLPSNETDMTSARTSGDLTEHSAISELGSVPTASSAEELNVTANMDTVITDVPMGTSSSETAERAMQPTMNSSRSEPVMEL